jgi:hypothetical protein
MQGNDIESPPRPGFLRQSIQVLQFKWVVAFLALLIVAYGAYYYATPHYKGRTVAYWFKVRGSRPSEAKVAFEAMGANAVPFLASQLERRPSHIFLELNAFLVRLFPRIQSYELQRLNRQMGASYLLGELGESARPAIPALESVAPNSMGESGSIAAKAALIKIRKESLAPYIERLRDANNDHDRFANTLLLEQLGTNARAAVPLLLDALHHTNSVVQCFALRALGGIHSEPDPCVSAVVPFLTNGHPAVRATALGTVLAFQTNANKASNEIINTLSDPEPHVRYMALLAVKEVLTPQAQRRALPKAEALLQDSEPFVRKNAKKLLPQIRASAAP